MSKPLLTADAAYQKIQDYYNANGSKINIKELFDNDPKRFDKFSLVLKTPNDGDILLVSTSFIYNLLKFIPSNQYATHFLLCYICYCNLNANFFRFFDSFSTLTASVSQAVSSCSSYNKMSFRSSEKHFISTFF